MPWVKKLDKPKLLNIPYGAKLGDGFSIDYLTDFEPPDTILFQGIIVYDHREGFYPDCPPQMRNYLRAIVNAESIRAKAQSEKEEKEKLDHRASILALFPVNAPTEGEA